MDTTELYARLFKTAVHDATDVDRLQWAARHLQLRHQAGDFALVSGRLEAIGGAHARFMVLEMLLMHVPPQHQPQELRHLAESLTGDVVDGAPLSRRRRRLVTDLAKAYVRGG